MPFVIVHVIGREKIRKKDEILWTHKPDNNLFHFEMKKAIQASKVEAKESPVSVHIIAQGDDQ
jgi:hypothetical protein